jgi:methyl-accepting chemotaxis protein
MPTSIDSLQIEINAQATKANSAIDRLVVKLDTLSKSLGRIPTGNITGLANGVEKLGRAMRVMGNIDSRSFTRLANNINKLSHVDTVSINNASSSIRRLANSFNVIGNSAANTGNITQLASALSKLGGKNVTNAIANIPQLAVSVQKLMSSLSKAPTVSQNVIDMTNALANLSAQGKKVGTASTGLRNALNGTHKSMTNARNSATSLAAAFGKLYANYFLVIRGAKAFVNAIKGTSDYIEAYNYYNVAFGKIASEWDKDWQKYGYANAKEYSESFTKRMQESLSKMSGIEVALSADGKGMLTTSNLKNLGLNIQEITQYASQLASVTNSVGQTGEVSLAAARSFTKLGADISSLFNIDYSDVMANLQSGLIGQSRALYKYGIDITNATLQTYAYNLGLEKSVSEMTQAEKMQLRMVAILDQSKVAWGDLANTINYPSNMMRQFGNNIKEVGLVLGQLFIPLLEKVMPILNGITIALKEFLINIAGFLGIKIDFDDLGQGFTVLGDGAEELADGLDDLSDSAKRVTKSLGKFDELNNISLPTSGNGALGASIDLTDEILRATEEYEKAWEEAFNRMEVKAKEFAKKFSKVLKPLENIFRKIKIGDWFGAGQDVSKLIKNIFDFFSRAIKKVNWKKLGEKIGEFIAGIDWYDVLVAAFTLKFNIWQAIADAWFSSFDAAPIETAIITAIAVLKFTPLGSILSDKIKASLLGAFASAGGIGGILTADLATVIGTGSFGTIAATFATGLGGSIVASILGYNLGEKISVAIWPENQKYIEMSWTEQWSAIFKSFEDGSFVGAFKLIGEDIATFVSDGFADIWQSIDEVIISPFEDAFADIWQSFDEIFITPFVEFWNDITAFSEGGRGTGGRGGGGGGGGHIRGYATGGFPEDGLFFANHNELVGQFSNGKTAVANNQQITQGIADAVYPAVYGAMVTALSEQGIKVDVGVESDTNGIFNLVQKGASNYQKRTGKPAFG